MERARRMSVENPFDCKQCKKYSTCTTLCTKVLRFADQDEVKRYEGYTPHYLDEEEQEYKPIEIPIEVDELDLAGKDSVHDYKNIIYTRMKQIERKASLTMEHRAIVAMHLGEVDKGFIAKYMNKSISQINRIIDKYL